MRRSRPFAVRPPCAMPSIAPIARLPQRNAQIVAALSQTTGLDLGDQPMDWWAWWWQDYNEMYNVSGATDQSEYDRPKPEYHCETLWSTTAARPAYLPSNDRRKRRRLCPYQGNSCFAPGTKVWTLTGRQPIEEDQGWRSRAGPGRGVRRTGLQAGIGRDDPAARSVDENRPGHGVDHRYAQPSVLGGRPGLADDQATQGRQSRSHVIGRRARRERRSRWKPIFDHSGTARAAYNLIVADYSSYFVGDRGILVHDNTPRAPTAAVLPGLTQTLAR